MNIKRNWFLFLHGIGPIQIMVYISFFGEVLLSLGEVGGADA